MIDFKALAKPFDFEDLEWRTRTVKKFGDSYQAMIMPYVTARAIQDRLDAIVGQDKWWNQFETWKQGQICGITIATVNGNITKWDGAEDTKESPLKGGLSDSMKRAAVQWGIGRYLYYLPPMKGQQIKWEPGAISGNFRDDDTKKWTKLWWKPNAAAVKAIKAASEGKQ